MWEPEEEWWRGIDHFPDFYVSSWGNIKQKSTGEYVEQFIDDDRMFHTENVPFVSINQWEWSYRGPVWYLILKNFFYGNYDDVKFEYMDNDPTNLHLDNLIPVYMDPKKGWTEIKWSIDKLKYRHLDRRRGRRVQIVETEEIFDTVAQVARAVDGASTNIYQCLKNPTKSYHGFHYQFIE